MDQTKIPGMWVLINDKLRLNGVDICIDLNNKKLPFDDSIIDEIYTSHFIEQLEETVKLFEEFNRNRFILIRDESKKNNSSIK